MISLMQNTWIWVVAIITILLVILRPKKINEAVWAVLGALLLVVLGFLPLKAAVSAVLKGTDVYLFLVGMMLLAETAREQKLFDWLACRATAFARGSATKLFLLVYGVGTLVTNFFIKRCNRSCTYASCRLCSQVCQGKTTASLPSNMCFYCQCRFFCATHLKPC